MKIRWRPTAWLGAVILAITVGAAIPSAFAQTVESAPQSGGTTTEGQPDASEPTRQDLQDMLETLRDPARRDELAKQIETLLQVQQAEAPQEEPGIGARILDTLSSWFEQFSRFMTKLGESFSSSGHLLRWLETQASDPAQRAMWLQIGQDLALSLGAGLVAALATWFAIKPTRRRLAVRAGDGLFRRLRFASVRLVLEILPIIAFCVIALAVASWTAPIPNARLVLLAIINATLFSMAGALIARFLFSPMLPGLRFLPLADSSAVYLYIWSRRLIVVGVWGYMMVQTALLLGLPPAGYVAAVKSVGFVVTALLVILVLQNRETGARWIRGGAAAGTRRIVPGIVRNRLAEVWHVLLVAYLIGLFVVWALDIPGGFFYVLRATIITALVIAAVAAGERWLPRLFNRFSGLDATLVARHPIVAARANRYIPTLRRIVVYAVRIAAILLILAAWRVDVAGFLFGQFGRSLLGSVADIIIVLVLALAAWEILGGIIYARLSQRDESGSDLLRSARIRTLLPLARNVLLIVIIVMTSLVILSEIGVDIAPLLAGAGVVGLAIGFGAQSLVKDVITGAFFLFEGTIHIGDVVDINGKGGLVEGMTIRSIRLRDYNGNLHTINFGSVGVITNMTRDYGYYVCDVKVAYHYDVDMVIATLRETAEELRKDKVYQHDIVEPIEIAGVETFADTTLIVRSRIKTRPIRQWDVGREFLRRLKLRFEAKDIQLAVPALPANVTVSEGGANKAQVAAAVATRRRRPDKPPADEEPASG